MPLLQKLAAKAKAKKKKSNDAKEALRASHDGESVGDGDEDWVDDEGDDAFVTARPVERSQQKQVRIASDDLRQGQEAAESSAIQGKDMGDAGNVRVVEPGEIEVSYKEGEYWNEGQDKHDNSGQYNDYWATHVDEQEWYEEELLSPGSEQVSMANVMPAMGLTQGEFEELRGVFNLFAGDDTHITQKELHLLMRTVGLEVSYLEIGIVS